MNDTMTIRNLNYDDDNLIICSYHI